MNNCKASKKEGRARPAHGTDHLERANKQVGVGDGA
jgi:hypothetical protein